jgi:hypothetical protein
MTNKQLGDVSGISGQRASQLRRQGLSDLQIRAGIRRRPKLASGAASPTANGHAADYANKSLIDLHREKLVLDNERRKLELAERRGDLVRTEMVQMVVANIASSFRSTVAELTLLPQQLRDRCDCRPGAEVEQTMRVEVDRIIARLHAENLRAVELLGERVNAAYRAGVAS